MRPDSAPLFDEPSPFENDDLRHLHRTFTTFHAACSEAREVAVANFCETFLVSKGDQWEVWIDFDEDTFETSIWWLAESEKRDAEKKRQWIADLDAQDHDEMPGKCGCGSYFCPECGG